MPHVNFHWLVMALWVSHVALKKPSKEPAQPSQVTHYTMSNFGTNKVQGMVRIVVGVGGRLVLVGVDNCDDIHSAMAES